MAPTPHRRPVSFFTLALSIFAAGCGGKGGGLGAETASVSASPKAIAYGADAKISWTSASSASFIDSNFGLIDSNFHGGSMTDTPGTTSTYSFRVRSSSGNTVPATATVTVAPISAGVLVVGDSAQAGPEQMAGFLRGLTTGSVDVAAALPSPSSSYRLLVVSPTIAADAGAAGRVKAWLDAGKGVVLCGKAPRVLATGNPNNSDVSAIGSWFFGTNTVGNVGFSGKIRTSSSGLVRLSAVVRGQEDGNDNTETRLVELGPQVDAIDGATGFNELDVYIAAYEVPTGGRLVFSASPVGYGATNGGRFQQAFESALRWCAVQ